jgi:chromosome segregation ATPase
MEQLQNQNSELNSLNQSLQLQEAEFNRTLSSSSNKVQDSLKELELEKNRCSELNDILKVKEETENNLNETLISLRQDILDKEQRLGELDEIRRSLELELTTLKEHQTSFQEEVIKKEEAIQSFASNENDFLKEQDKSLQDLKEKVDCFSKEKVELEEEINRLREVESHTKTYQEKIEKSCKQIEEMQVSNGKMHSSLLVYLSVQAK